MNTKLASRDIADLDRYKFMATICRRVIHPGCRKSRDALLERAAVGPDDRVIDVGAKP